MKLSRCMEAFTVHGRRRTHTHIHTHKHTHTHTHTHTQSSIKLFDIFAIASAITKVQFFVVYLSNAF